MPGAFMCEREFLKVRRALYNLSGFSGRLIMAWLALISYWNSTKPLTAYYLEVKPNLHTHSMGSHSTQGIFKARHSYFHFTHFTKNIPTTVQYFLLPVVGLDERQHRKPYQPFGSKVVAGPAGGGHPVGRGLF